ncbi:hypothetical protein Ccur_07560 [Cryptobacterium curtum DSM 15641]|uniref:Uncharacterized protein n=1 Tax=Cryptobacterium curtum (strain ATCC 700683 / DSM 15641 / CCUG 43107 / 12-3) TaxID=469378 RepID=C7MNH2_CRYCD|nr:hypothetical protein Ccur_07560 [Cryptobacterium curtum DSM 15641]
MKLNVRTHSHAGKCDLYANIELSFSYCVTERYPFE